MTITRETVRVTAEHIAHGKRGTGPSPVALALGELHPGIPVDAYSNWAHLCGTDDGCLNADLPAEAEDFERAFENGQDVAPLEFTVRWEAAEEEDAEDEPMADRSHEADPDKTVDFNGETTKIRDLPPAMAAMFGYGHILSPGEEWRKVLPGEWPYTPQTCRRSDGTWPGTWIDPEHLACTGCGLDST